MANINYNKTTRYCEIRETTWNWW